MKPKFIVLHRRDANNVGDMASEPLQYFLPRNQYDVVDVTDISSLDYTAGVPMILGGGGLFGNSFMGEPADALLTLPDRQRLQALAEHKWTVTNPSIKHLGRQFHDGFQDLVARTLERIPMNSVPKFVWAAGHNSDQIQDRVKYTRYLSEYRLVGLRDWHGADSRWGWVPCASCMHSVFNRQHKVVNDVIWFEHKKRIVKDFGSDSIPRFVNSGNNFEQTIELLGSANIILTNSYHGAYWGTLLKKRVVVVDPWSTKFQFFRHPPVLLNNRKQHWRDAVEQAQIYPEALDLSRAANQEFWVRIQRSLEEPAREDSSLKLDIKPTAQQPLQPDLFGDTA
jgi:hypothetical protein